MRRVVAQPLWLRVYISAIIITVAALFARRTGCCWVSYTDKHVEFVGFGFKCLEVHTKLWTGAKAEVSTRLLPPL